GRRRGGGRRGGERDPERAGLRQGGRGRLRRSAARALSRPLVVPRRVVPAPEDPAGPPDAWGVGRRRSARSSGGEWARAAARVTHPALHLSRRRRSPPERRAPDGRGGGAGPAGATGGAGETGRRAGLALRPLRARPTKHPGRRAGPLRRGHRRPLRLPALGTRLGAGGAACRRPRARPLEGECVGESVVIVNWNAGEALGACVASLADDARRGSEVIVVDNASSDGSIAAARS